MGQEMLSGGEQKQITWGYEEVPCLWEAKAFHHGLSSPRGVMARPPMQVQ